MSGSVSGFQSGMLSQSVLGCIIGNAVNGQRFGKVIEVDVTGYFQCTDNANVAVRAGTAICVVMEEVSLSAEIGAVGIDDSFAETSCCRNGLECRTGSV